VIVLSLPPDSLRSKFSFCLLPSFHFLAAKIFVPLPETLSCPLLLQPRGTVSLSMTLVKQVSEDKMLQVGTAASFTLLPFLNKRTFSNTGT
jgi:hypothetical protein